MKSPILTAAALIAPAAALFLSVPAAAQTIDPFSTDYFTKVTWDDINRRTSDQAREARKKAAPSPPRRASSPKSASPQTSPRQVTPRQVTPRQSAARPAPAASPAALDFRPTGALARSKGINALVAHYSAAEQAGARANYVAMIESFNNSVPRLYGVRKNNMATGTAALLTGAYVAYTNRPFPDAWVRPLVAQLESTMVEDKNLTGASAADKETAYHVMVGTGMTLQVAQAELAKKPDARKAAELRRMGADIFRKMQINDPARIRFSENGISIR